jgi:capsular exopolysaccharide synthesis family protein
LNLQDFLKLLRTRWITVCVTVLVAVIGAGIVTLLTTPLYQASTRLFVSTAGGSTITDTYQGNRVSQERVISYSQLLTGRTLAQRTIDKLGLDTTSAELQAHVTASARPDTVLITVQVLDESPVQARDIANALSDEFVVLVRELETPEDGSAPDSRVVVEERASIPESPVVPKAMRNFAVGLICGALLGIGLAVVRDMLDNTVKSRESVEEITGHGLVGSIPLDKERRKQVAIAFDSDSSAIAEAFRKLRTNLKFLAVDNPPRVIVVTSSMPSEGKSTTAINLALALAEADNSVALVDGDLRRPAVAKYLGLVGSVGFSTVLSGQVELEDALQKGPNEGLTVLASGAIPPNPSELLGSLAAQDLLEELRKRFDYVVVDSSPLLAVTDAAVIAAHADGVLLIPRYGKTKREQLTHAVSALNDVGATILGAVMTIVPVRSNDAYSYNYRYEATEPQRKALNGDTNAEATNPEAPRPDRSPDSAQPSVNGSSLESHENAPDTEAVKGQTTS